MRPLFLVDEFTKTVILGEAQELPGPEDLTYCIVLTG